MDFIDRTGRYIRCEKEDYKWGLNRHEFSLTLCFKATNGGGASTLASVTQWGQAESYSMITVQLVETSSGFTAGSAIVSCLAPHVLPPSGRSVTAPLFSPHKCDVYLDTHPTHGLIYRPHQFVMRCMCRVINVRSTRLFPS